MGVGAIVEMFKKGNGGDCSQDRPREEKDGLLGMVGGKLCRPVLLTWMI